MRRKLLACLLCACMLLGMLLGILPVNLPAKEISAEELETEEVATEEVATEEPAIDYGDVNEDGDIKPDDALMILKHIVKLSEFTDEAVLEAADVDRDGNITTSDALNVICYVVKLRDNISDGGVVESETAKMSLAVNENVVSLNIDESDWHQFSVRLTWDENVEATSRQDIDFLITMTSNDIFSCVSNPQNGDTATEEFLAAGVCTDATGYGAVYTGTIYTLTFDPEVYDVEVTLYDGIDGGSAVQTVIVNPTLEETATPEPKDPTAPEGLEYEIIDGAVTITDYTGSATELTIPSEIGGYPVTDIGKYTFYGCTSLTSVTIPSSVTSIGYGAFFECYSLTNVTIADGVEDIEREAFYGCNSLKQINIPNSVKSVGKGAFEDTAYYNDDANWQEGVLYLDGWLLEGKEDISGSYQIMDGMVGVADLHLAVVTA